jgi:hypothetical protein
MICGLFFVWTAASMEKDVDNDDITFEIIDSDSGGDTNSNSGEDTNNITGMRDRMALRKDIARAQERYYATLMHTEPPFRLSSTVKPEKTVVTSEKPKSSGSDKFADKSIQSKKESTTRNKIRSWFGKSKEKNYV